MTSDGQYNQTGQGAPVLQVKRRGFLRGAAITAGAVLGVPLAGVGTLWAGNRLSAPGPDLPDRSTPMQTVGYTRSGMAIHVLRTGFVRVKRSHRQWSGPAALRLPAIIGDLAWSDWMPIHCYLLLHRDGPILVDTGETDRVNEPDHFACDPGSGWFIGSNLRLDVRPDETIVPQLARLGLGPDDIRTVVMSHLHTDHVGGMSAFPKARFLINRNDWPGHMGATPCLMPLWLKPDLVTFQAQAMGAFEQSFALGEDIALVPTPGHSPGHQSVLVRDDDRWWLVGGDASFDDVQVREGARAGIVEDWEASLTTLQTIAAQLASAPTIYAPAHDPAAANRVSLAMPSPG